MVTTCIAFAFHIGVEQIKFTINNVFFVTTYLISSGNVVLSTSVKRIRPPGSKFQGVEFLSIFFKKV